MKCCCRSDQGLRILMGCALVAALMASCADSPQHGRRFIDATWDTVAIIGGTTEDTTLLRPVRLVRWRNRFVVIDALPPFIRTFSADGDLLWTYGREGEGPGEFDVVWAARPTDEGTLLVLDPNLHRITALDSTGALIAQHDVPAPMGVDFTIAQDQLLIAATDRRRATVIRARDELSLILEQPLGWADTLPAQAHLARWIERIPGEVRSWVSALQYGPGFSLHTDPTAEFHPYVEPIPLWIGRVDSLAYAARSLDVVAGNIYMLFGGWQPPPPGDRQLPSTVDVYGLTGEYSHSYRLPVDAFHMTTDSERFYVLRFAPAPALLVLRIVRES